MLARIGLGVSFIHYPLVRGPHPHPCQCVAWPLLPHGWHCQSCRYAELKTEDLVHIDRISACTSGRIGCLLVSSGTVQELWSCRMEPQVQQNGAGEAWDVAPAWLSAFVISHRNTSVMYIHCTSLNRTCHFLALWLCLCYLICLECLSLFSLAASYSSFMA